jgi:hypothetical protein
MQMRFRRDFFSFVRKAFLLCGLFLMVCDAGSALATVPEEREFEAESVSLTDSSEVLQISEAALSTPFMAAENTELLRQKVLMVTSYVQSYNSKLPSTEIGSIAEAIVRYSDRYGVDYRLLTSLIAIESAFRRDAVSSSGAIGMGQLKPTTAKWLGVVNPYDPVDNIAGTARFLGWLVRKYNGNLEYALSAYYQGPGYVDRNGVSAVCLPYLQKVNKALGTLL